MKIGQHRQSSFWAKRWTSEDVFLLNRGGHVQYTWICVAECIFAILVGQHPTIVRQAHALKLIFELEKVPAIWFNEIFAAWCVLKTIQILNVDWQRERERKKAKGNCKFSLFSGVIGVNDYYHLSLCKLTLNCWNSSADELTCHTLHLIVYVGIVHV